MIMDDNVSRTFVRAVCNMESIERRKSALLIHFSL